MKRLIIGSTSESKLEQKRAAKRLGNKANKEITLDILYKLAEEGPLDKLQALDKALQRTASLTSTYAFPFATVRVYKQGWYITLEGTRADFSIWAYDNDGEYEIGRKPNDSKLDFLYKDHINFNDVSEDFWYSLTEEVR